MLFDAQVFPVQCDVKDPASVEAAVSKSIEEFGQLPNIVINNAAGNFISPTEYLSHKAWRSIIDIVLYGTINVTMDIGKRLITAKQGIDHSASISVVHCWPSLSTVS